MVKVLSGVDDADVSDGIDGESITGLAGTQMLLIV